MLVPLTREHFLEWDEHLQPHHIVALSDDIPRIQRALDTIPCRRRPKLRDETGIQEGSLRADKPSSSAHNEDLDSDVSSTEEIELVVERTFLNYQVMGSSEVTQSEPCGGADAPQPRNPSGRCPWRA